MIKTEFFDDFLVYYRKAKVLQEANLNGPGSVVFVDHVFHDPLMENVAIYDTVNRRHAGFSKALEDLHDRRARKDLKRYGSYRYLDVESFHFIHLFHRFTGSGASFEPRVLQDGSLNPREHGYCNCRCQEVAQQLILGGIDFAKKYIVSETRPMVTSIGNQPPSLKKPRGYRLAMQWYFDKWAEAFIMDYLYFCRQQRRTIKQAVDFSTHWHKDRGFKQWHFVLTAFVMDTAEYYPELVVPESHCYYGSNCIKAFKLMFDKDSRQKPAIFWEDCMMELCEAVLGRPYDVEDVCCDYIRYLVQYVPKGYEHLRPEQTWNNSTLKVVGLYKPEVIKRMGKILSWPRTISTI